MQPKLTAQQQASLQATLKKAGLGDMIEHLRNETSLLPTVCDENLCKFITEDKDMIELKTRVKKVFNRTEPVLILGETGTGKELIARALHSGRKGIFKAINITSLPSELIESELFGHIAGSFTGAISSKMGLMEAAANGTLFLDEIGDMPLNAQAKLLRALQDKIIRRVGDVKDMEITCRIVCATHRNIEEMVEQKTFREDLYWRLNPIILRTKPLRERQGDVLELLDAIFDVEGEIPDEVRTAWCNLPLRGNVRELEARALRYKLFKEV